MGTETRGHADADASASVTSTITTYTLPGSRTARSRPTAKRATVIDASIAAATGTNSPRFGDTPPGPAHPRPEPSSSRPA